jgi:hypothetical protein
MPDSGKAYGIGETDKSGRTQNSVKEIQLTIGLGSRQSDELDSCIEGNHGSVASAWLSLAPDWWLRC